ncbi:MAG TPA: hypothetical protein VL549_00445, partial [Gemmatimonadales bacterium]|nr:hypothetical protein [Gemmatimonadales bacterium]
DTIIIQNHNVFDRDDDAPDWVARVANRVHVRTRQWVIRRRLLLDRGDPFDVARMEESERALRTLGVFRNVRVDTVRTPAGKLALRAVTADGWSTQPQASFTSAGGDKTWAAGFVERNFLGTGTQLAMIYGKNPDRSQLDFEFLNPNFVGRRTLLHTRYSDLSDGNHGQWQFGLPFYETAARYSLETTGEVARERVLRFRDDTLQDSTRHHLFRLGLIGGVAARATTRRYVRLWAGWEWRREDFTPTDTSRVRYSVFTTVRAGVDVGAVRFRVMEHFNSYARREDVDLSPTVHLGIVMQSGNVGYEFSGQTSAVWKGGFVLLRTDANGLDTTRTRGQVTVVSQNIARHTLILHAEGGVVTHPKPGGEFDPWVEQREPRLFGLHDFTGTRTTWFAFEDRILVADDILGMVAFGVAPFVDYGGAWYGDEPARQGGDAGLSLRFGPTRAVRGDAAEFAFGYRWGPGERKPWAFTLRKGFSF